MIEIKGAHNTALCFTDDLEASAAEQIRTVCDQPAFSDAKIRIMPDVHAGMGCTIGTTMTIGDKIVPGMVGVDIGCGMETVTLAQKKLDFSKLDAIIRKNIPAGHNVRRDVHPFSNQIDLEALRLSKGKLKLDRARHSIGSLGGGNHFIEVASSQDGTLFLVVHSGSRHIGNEVATHYQSLAAKQMGWTPKQSLPRDLTYVSGGLFDDYLHDMKLIQQFATRNRQAMTEIILQKMGLTEVDRFTTIHNYIDLDAMILRKGAVSAKKGERLLIPINMRDGSLICIGRGNPDWNCSAPHGAGRIMSRKAAMNSLSLGEYQAQMQKVFSTSVNRATLDEAPMAYKSMDHILRHIAPTADVVAHIKPLYNFKAGA